jgi:hypothetical protein
MRVASEYRYRHFFPRLVVEDMNFHDGPKPGEPMPDFDLPLVAGGRVRKADFVGERPLFLTFASVT